jgi:hypothetical protein
MRHVAILLDLADQYPFTRADLETAMLPDRPAVVVELSRFGVAKAREGTPGDWEPTIAAIEEIAAAARAGEHDGVPRRYWIADGRGCRRSSTSGTCWGSRRM